ncbi:MAG: sialate O-acetylesterase, partial [Planctomycetaceae bacterium]|nr:sialate O-acetylesterase [Planctomycetaceae bacterium]
MKPRLIPLILLLAIHQSVPVAADVRLPRVFGNQMLLQRGLAVPVWGWADAGEQVAVKFAGDQQQTIADKRGRWKVRLKPLKASA